MAKYKIIPSSRTIVQLPISIGHKAEKGVEAIEFDLTAWVGTYGSGTATIIMRRWGDEVPYPVALEIDENNKAVWTLSDTDTAKAGMAYAQLSYIVGDEVVKKSDIYTFRVMDSLTGEGDPPEAYESWLEHLTHLAAEAMAEVLDIEGIVTDKTLTVDGGVADGKATGDALALKADKSTTYTKAEVDQMIEDVEVETDTTLAIAGAPADAAETGRQIDLLKADLDDMTISESENTFSYEQGNIRTTSGTTFDADNRVRFAAAYALPAGAMKVFEITVADGYKASVREYKNPDGTGFNGYADWVSGTSTYKPKSDTKSVKCVVAADDDSDITPSNLPSGVLTLKFRFATDKTLTQADKAPDAKAVGDTFDEIRTSNEQTVTAWLQGSISNENGGNRNPTNRCRSLGYYHNEQTSAINLTIKSGYKLTARAYDSDDIVSPTSHFAGNPLGETFVTGQQTMQVNPVYYYRFVIASNDDADITPSEVPADALTIAFSSWTDETLTKSNKAADAKAVRIELTKRPLMPDVAGSQLLGNVSIAAAKTINFSDGTPPHVDWYLLMDTANNFYMSKDLIHKKYLFTFTPPSASVPDWSVGIDGNNNVLFFKDAAGYTNNDGPRLDDNKRVNPVYYLAEEGYNEMHPLDFGEEFKPAGWIGNVGWCVLPDGDIILCEYTRGTLKTCNVWHVDGSNITDPESWTVTWSHDIIDTTDATTSGMKHCHEVMYDFYTDICYFGTGDSDDGSYNYYSTDHGLTWTLLYGPDKNRCRRLNFIFTPDKVYWASDSYESANHHFFIADRDAETGVVDVENATEVALGWYNSESCYGCVYMPAENLIVFMDRVDREGSTIYDLIFKGYDLVSNSIVTLATVPHTGSDKHAGFRCKYVEWYAIGNTVICGFSPASASVNSNTNQNAVCGNLGGTTGNGSERINNLKIHIYRKPDNTFFVRFDTVYC